jgi:hypothetical protein
VPLPEQKKNKKRVFSVSERHGRASRESKNRASRGRKNTFFRANNFFFKNCFLVQKLRKTGGKPKSRKKTREKPFKKLKTRAEK